MTLKSKSENYNKQKCCRKTLLAICITDEEMSSNAVSSFTIYLIIHNELQFGRTNYVEINLLCNICLLKVFRWSENA